MKKILIPIDGSKNSKRALSEGKKLSELLGSEITILYVEPEPKFRGPYSEIYMTVETERKEEVGKKVINEGLELLKDHSTPVNSKFEFGDPADKIIEVAENENVDLIVMGSRGLSAIKRFVLGSVSNKVLNHADTSVLIIR